MEAKNLMNVSIARTQLFIYSCTMEKNSRVMHKSCWIKEVKVQEVKKSQMIKNE